MRGCFGVPGGTSLSVIIHPWNCQIKSVLCGGVKIKILHFNISEPVCQADSRVQPECVLLLMSGSRCTAGGGWSWNSGNVARLVFVSITQSLTLTHAGPLLL